MTLPRIGISIGDPAGIGPEVTLRALFLSGALPPARYVLFGSRPVLEKEATACGISVEIPSWKADESCAGAGVYLRNLPGPRDPVNKGEAGASAGRASFAWFEEAASAARRGEMDALVTAPVAKAGWKLAGIPWRGHTEYLESFFPDAVMSFWSEKLTVALLSHHLPLRDALARVNRPALARLFRILRECPPARAAGPDFEILVAGLNPHAGEGGHLGREEIEVITPVLDALRARGMSLTGPLPADTAFLPQKLQEVDAVLAMYHDQGLIPVKYLGIDDGVNVTLGLPFVRTSPDHGTAFDKAGQPGPDRRGLADPASLIAAIRQAIALSAATTLTADNK